MKGIHLHPTWPRGSNAPLPFHRTRGGVPLTVQREQKLSELPPGYLRFRVGRDLVLMDTHTREVLDVIRAIFP